MSQRVQLPTAAVKRAMAAEAVVNEDLKRETVREDAGEGRVGTQLVARGLVALIPATDTRVDVAALRVKGRNTRD
jgi:hypothetical protein